MITHKGNGPEKYSIAHDGQPIGSASKEVSKPEGSRRKETSFILVCDAPGQLSGQTFRAATMKALKLAVALKLGVPVDAKPPKAPKPVKEAVAEPEAPSTESADIDLE